MEIMPSIAAGAQWRRNTGVPQTRQKQEVSRSETA
jgi:hypothetical protein